MPDKYKELEKQARVARSLFWEFYAQYHLWFMIGSGKESYGYKQDQIFNHRLIEKIDSRFEQTTDLFFTFLQKYLEESIRSEMKYVFDSGLGDFDEAIDSRKFEGDDDEEDEAYSYVAERASKSLTRYLKKYDKKINRNRSYKTAPIEWARIAFEWDGWNDSYCGPLWAHGCTVLLEAPLFKTLKQRIMWIDNCLDLYHNNGFLLNKTICAVWERCNDLNTRAKLSSWPEAVKTNKLIKKSVQMDGSKESIEVTQSKYPLTYLTRNLILRYAHKI